MRQLITSTIAVAASLTAVSVANAGYWAWNGFNYVYVPTCEYFWNGFAYVGGCG